MSGKSKAPAFQMYAADFLVDENVVCMTLEERGAYITLMCFCWREGSIPNDVKKLASLCNVSNENMDLIWQNVNACFEKCEKNDQRLIHKRLELERKNLQKFKKNMTERAKRGAEARWGKGIDGYASSMPQASASNAQAMLKNASSSSTSSSNLSNLTVTSLGDSCESQKKAQAVKSQSRGTRLPSDWTPTPEVMEWARNERHDIDVARELDIFRDYWISKPGQSGLKLDWYATFKNWIRRAKAPYQPARITAAPKPIVPGHMRQEYQGKL